MFRKRLNLIYLQIYIIYMFRKRLNSNDGPVTVSGKALCNVSITRAVIIHLNFPSRIILAFLFQFNLAFLFQFVLYRPDKG